MKKKPELKAILNSHGATTLTLVLKFSTGEKANVCRQWNK
jgi:hypothetical protein